MVKVLGQAGISLSDLYDVDGSIVGVAELHAQEVQAVHEMGGTMFSERLGGSIARFTGGIIAQNISWNTHSFDFASIPTRILGACVVTLASARLANCQISIRDPVSEREIPIFVWDETVGTVVTARFVENGGALATFDFLSNSLDVGTLPSMVIGFEQDEPVPGVVFRGLSNGFGAGTVEAIALVYRTFPQGGGGINQKGLPIPSW